MSWLFEALDEGYHLRGLENTRQEKHLVHKDTLELSKYRIGQALEEWGSSRLSADDPMGGLPPDANDAIPHERDLPLGVFSSVCVLVNKTLTKAQTLSWLVPERAQVPRSEQSDEPSNAMQSLSSEDGCPDERNQTDAHPVSEDRV